MTIKEVIYYEVVCNGCGKKSFSPGVCAWADRSMAVDDWQASEGIVTAGGFALCGNCTRALDECCPVLTEDETHLWGRDGICLECDRTVEAVHAAETARK